MQAKNVVCWSLAFAIAYSCAYSRTRKINLADDAPLSISTCARILYTCVCVHTYKKVYTQCL